MTRDEFIRRWSQRSTDVSVADLFVAAGMLKLEEPSQDAVIQRNGLAWSVAKAFRKWEANGGHLMDYMDEAGLKIVEK